MTNDDLKRFYRLNANPEQNIDFVRYDKSGKIQAKDPTHPADVVTLQYFQQHIDSTSVEIDALSTAQTGTLTEAQVQLLQANDNNYILFNNEIYRLADKQTQAGYLVYSHTGQDNTQHFFIKCITITLSTLGWSLTSTQVN